ncbi:ABC transporter permease [Nocardioides sp. NPDC004968]|uniref:ABC transporter permease n=1 Tax=Nocardioides sp. NPDC004968 TaxID=3155894 RepID=UPI0033A53D1F
MSTTTTVKSPPQASTPAGGRPARRPWLSPKFVVGTAAVLTALVAWQVVVLLEIKPRGVLPGPFDVLDEGVSMFQQASFWADMGASFQELVIGLFFAVLVGLPLGLLIGWYRPVDWALSPFITFLYATPRIAMTPLIIVFFGFGITPKVIIVFLMSVFPILINTAQGMHALEQGVVRVAQCFGASDLQLFRTVALPGTVPFIAGGLRLAVGQALIGVYVAELSGAQHGVGMMMNTAAQQYQSSKIFVGLFVFAITGVALTALLRRVEAHFASWRPASH